MADTAAGPRLWTGQLALLVICCVLIFLHLLPLNTLPTNWPAPDLLLAVVLAWVARRPDLAPALMIGLVFLLADLLFQRPPGLMAALVLVLSEMLRARSRALRSTPFLLEWATISIGIMMIALLNHVVMALLLMPLASLTLVLTQAAFTCLCYPIVTVLAYIACGVSRLAPGEVDALGHRL